MAPPKFQPTPRQQQFLTRARRARTQQRKADAAYRAAVLACHYHGVTVSRLAEYVGHSRKVIYQQIRRFTQETETP